MTGLQTEHWRYLHGEPQTIGILKSSPEDFVVTEILGYEPIGEGEHIYLWVRKTGLNTAFVAEQIAKYCQVPLRNVTYAGRKDKEAVTYQWFSVHQPGKKEFDWAAMSLDGFDVLKSIRHNKKLRTGVLKGNAFKITLRQLRNADSVDAKLHTIATQGVPNYYGSQRFGQSHHHQSGGNLVLAQKMLEGELIRNRNKRSMAISALRSWLFNEYIDARIEKGWMSTPVDGDICILSGSNSYFCASPIDDVLLQRIQEKDVFLSAPLWGKGQLDSRNVAQLFEVSLSQQHAAVCHLLESLGLQQERRAIMLYPEDMRWQFNDTDLTLEFSLPSGCFATSVVREIMHVEHNQEAHQ